MFKKNYKAANDDIKTNRELIDKIFEAAEKPSKTVKLANLYKIGTAIAAAVVLVVGALSYPQLVKLNETPNPTAEVVQPVKTVQPVEDNVSRPVNEKEVESTTQPETTEPIVQQKNPVTTAKEPAPQTSTDVENPDISVASEDALQYFSIPQGRTIDAPPSIDANEVSADSFNEITTEETERVQEFLIKTFGEKDEETGNVLIFEIAGKAEGMYLGRWKWFVVDHSSLLCEFVLNEELTEMYECTFTQNNAVTWNTQNNLLNN